MDTTKQMRDALVMEYMGGNQSRENELRALTKELIDFTYCKLGRPNSGSEAIVSESVNGINNISHEGEFDAMVVRNVAKDVASSIQENFLSLELPEKYSKGISYKYKNIRNENESFIPVSFGNDDFDYVWEFFETLKADQKLLVVMYYLGEMSVETIRELTKARVFAISANLQFVKDTIKERVAERQILTGEEFVSLSEKNILWITFLREFETKLTKGERASNEKEGGCTPKPISHESVSKATKKNKSALVPIAVIVILVLLGVAAWVAFC